MLAQSSPEDIEKLKDEEELMLFDKFKRIASANKYTATPAGLHIAIK